MTSPNNAEQSSLQNDGTGLTPEKKSQPAFFSAENLKSLAVLALIIFAIRWSIASPYYVPTASMEPTIKVGDRLLAWKLAYELKFPFTDYSLIKWAEPTRGDIIVFRYPRDPNIDYVKRIVAIGGDTVQLTEDVLFINGKAQERLDHNNDRSILEDIQDTKDYKILFKEDLEGRSHWVMQNKPEMRKFSIDQASFTVPKDSVFCVGDNRDNSSDSRVWGVVPLNYVRGRALFVIWSIWNPPGQTLPSFRFDRFGKWLDT
jgi:signal peptidase I